MVKRILIDAAHEEEIRLVLTEDNIIKAFDYHNKDRNSIKGNVYLAKVTRVEPSLQSAFVEYGGNKQGFLPLAEIHPDYYQIPKNDKEAILESMAKAKQEAQNSGLDDIDEDAKGGGGEISRPLFYKKYKIQEVMRKDQALLVQVTKEERGNKGAALSTYISLAGRYCVLLPNSGNVGGVSRKIDDAEERKRLRAVVQELSEHLEISNSVIVRTAGGHKTKTELKRDLSYLSRLWNNIRSHTLSSVAPAFIHEEGDIIKKAIRDLYDSDIDEIIVSGLKAYENAKDFTKLLLPRHVDKVKLHQAVTPIFSKYGIEEQLGKLYDHNVQLSSGGYIVINQTEALVAIDVNSGKSTGERSIENTALKNNLEAAKEVAGQLRLRDLSGLIVIDFIDMAEAKNRKEVEKALKDALSHDRARTQIGKISEFGILEMSRQRLRQSFSETYMLPCNHCAGRGRIRPENVTAIAIIRAIENEVARGIYNEVKVSCSQELVLYLLNQKCNDIANIVQDRGIKLSFAIDNEAGADGFFLEGVKRASESKKTALSAIDFEPYRIDNNEKEQVPKATEKSTKATKSSQKKKFKTQPAVENKTELDKIEEPKVNKNPKRCKKGFRSRSRNELKTFGDVEPNDEVAIDEVRESGSVEDSKNNSLLKEIWKKIVD
ncbi:MAG: Ribonuclease E/G [Candidatus Midichloria mitochondrii]|nr:Rne/Rng family ribonuclease [Candidatus Midichloria mitochondrii]MDJ1287691.1 Rne/Rng family ribonuclease [Candidatus Midichloria mitochondrii]MDJ1298553.1 Rne/Rng family ribonuclease [Candidatus Midichloria mitochondrii]MDJ1312689.1 Rne/Rng family ribonuclease [Candidatus Midichloria mitochondrii]